MGSSQKIEQVGGRRGVLVCGRERVTLAAVNSLAEHLGGHHAINIPPQGGSRPEAVIVQAAGVKAQNHVQLADFFFELLQIRHVVAGAAFFLAFTWSL